MLTVCTFAMLAVSVGVTGPAEAGCSDLPSHDSLTRTLQAAAHPTGGPRNGGLDVGLWAVLVDRDGKVCAVTSTGQGDGDAWLAARISAAQKANTANTFSHDSVAVSTANIYAPAQPGGSIAEIRGDPPLDPAHFGGDATAFGTPQDGMVGLHVGGVNSFGGGLALYRDGRKIGALGIAGDTSCADHNVAWRMRGALHLDKVPGGVSPNGDDGIIYDIASGASRSGYGHTLCGGSEVDVAQKIKAGG